MTSIERRLIACLVACGIAGAGCILEETVSGAPSGLALGGGGGPCGGYTCASPPPYDIDLGGAVAAVTSGAGGGAPAAECTGVVLDKSAAMFEIFCTGSLCECRYRDPGISAGGDCSGADGCHVLCTCELPEPVSTCPSPACCPEPWSLWTGQL